MKDIILYSIIYILIAGYSYMFFKKMSKNGWSESPVWQALFWPASWIIYIIIALIEGFGVLLNNKNE